MSYEDKLIILHTAVETFFITYGRNLTKQFWDAWRDRLMKYELKLVNEAMMEAINNDRERLPSINSLEGILMAASARDYAEKKKREKKQKEKEERAWVPTEAEKLKMYNDWLEDIKARRAKTLATDPNKRWPKTPEELIEDISGPNGLMLGSIIRKKRRERGGDPEMIGSLMGGQR